MGQITLPSLLLCTLATVFAANAADSRLVIEPAQPHPGGTLTVTFDPKGGPLEKSSSLTLIYGYVPVQTQRLPMQPKEGRFTAEIRIPEGSFYAYFWCWVEDPGSGVRDTNRGSVWDSYLYDESNLPRKNARESRSSMYQLQAAPAEKNRLSLQLLEEELRDYPDNGRARAEWWQLRFAEAGKTSEAQEKLAREISDFWALHPDQPWAYQAALEGYYLVGRIEQTLTVMRSFVKRFPEDNSVDGDLGLYFSFFGTAADMEGLQYASKRWAASPYYWQRLLDAYARAHAAPEKFQRAGEQWLSLVPRSRDPFGQARNRIAEVWLANGVDPKAAEQVAREAVSIAETVGDGGNNDNTYPDPTLIRRRLVTSVNRSPLGWALFQQGRYEEAVQELQRAAAAGEKKKLVMRDVYYRLGQALEHVGRPADAMDAYMKELAWGFDDVLPRNAAEAIYAKAHGGSAGFDAEVRSRVNDLVARSALAEPVQEVNEPIGRFELRGPDGQLVPLSRYAGKVVLIDYWATWCGPCASSLENTQKLVRQFPGKVVVLAVSIDGEETRGRAASYLKEHGYDFELLFDEEKRRDLAVPSVPSRFLVDPAGRLRVREMGDSVASNVVFEQKLRTLVDAQQ
jgi:peroxiredoxin/tetratricopeptide (TPR) repeat protein